MVGGRYHQGIEADQCVVDGAAQFGAQVLGLVGVAGAVLVAIFDDAAYHRVDMCRVDTFYRNRALGDPGAVIELFGQLTERAEVDGLERHAKAFQLLQRLLENRLGLGIAKEFQAVRYGEGRCGLHADRCAVGVLP